MSQPTTNKCSYYLLKKKILFLWARGPKILKLRPSLFPLNPPQCTTVINLFSKLFKHSVGISFVWQNVWEEYIFLDRCRWSKLPRFPFRLEYGSKRVDSLEFSKRLFAIVDDGETPVVKTASKGITAGRAKKISKVGRENPKSPNLRKRKRLENT